MRVGQNIYPFHLQQQCRVTDPSHRRAATIRAEKFRVGLEQCKLVSALGLFRQTLAPLRALPFPKSTRMSFRVKITKSLRRVMAARGIEAGIFRRAGTDRQQRPDGEQRDQPNNFF